MHLPTFSPALIKKAEKWILILIGLTVAVTVGITLLASGRSLTDHITAIPMHAVWWLVAATVAESLLRFWRYHVAMKALGITSVPWYRLMYYYTVGYALIPTPGKVGTAIRLWLLRQYHGLPYHRTAPLLVMDLLSDTIAMCSLASLCLLLLEESPRLNMLGWLLSGGILFILLITVIAPRLLETSVKIAYWLTGRSRPRTFARILTLVRTMAHVLGLKVLLTTTALSFVGWALIGIAIGYLATQSGTPSFGAAAGTLAIALSTMGGFVTMMPAGVGGAEVTMAGIFTMFGVPLAQAVLLTAIVRLIVLWSTVLLGLALLPIAIRNAPKGTPAAPRRATKTTITVIETTG